MNVPFSQGLTFRDIVTLNFSLTVDPDEFRAPGSGSAVSAIVFTPVCEVDNVYGTVGTTVQCGPRQTVPFINIAPGTKVVLHSMIPFPKRLTWNFNRSQIGKGCLVFCCH